MSLSAAQKAMQRLRELPADERRHAAAALIPELDAAMARTPLVDEAKVRAWIQLARYGTGRPIAVGRVDRLTPEQARAAVEEALGGIDHLAQVRAARQARDAADQAFHKAVGDAKRAGCVVADIREEAGGIAQQTVYDWTAETAPQPEA